MLLIVSLFAPFGGTARAQDEPLPNGIPAGVEAGEVSSHQGGGLMTVLLDGKKRTIVLLGVDAPLLDRGEYGECFATESQRQLKKLSPAGGTVYLESDPTVDKDDDGRLVRYVWTVRKGEALHLNFRMIRDGFADFDDGALGDDSSYVADFDKAIDSAKDNDRGLWDECGQAHKLATPPPTPRPVPTATPTAEEKLAEFVPLADVRELIIRPGGLLGQKIVLYGRILSIGVAPAGRVYTIGNEDPQEYSVYMQVWVLTPDGVEEPVVVGYDGDTAGMYEDSYVVVYATVKGTDSGTNAFGGSITQPYVEAELVQLQ